MKYDIIGKNGFEPTEAIKNYVTKRLNKVVSFFDPALILDVRVVLKVYKDHHKVEVTIPAKGIVLRSETSDQDMYTAIDKSVDKLIAQIKKHKEKLKTHLTKKGNSKVYSDEFETEDIEKEILASNLVKNKEVKLEPMSVEQALMEMEMSGHDFYVFLNEVTDKVNVAYLRDDGDYAVIETK
ncbi:MAG: ribosomal subunit interface protein [Tenericutes bacterium HGW-Tenericutes-8]|nr:MAG: ribosomal subunit interface protein [Tenericutes bacterium HGW-Tenericutes-8]